MGLRGTRLETGNWLKDCYNNAGRRKWVLNLGNGTGNEEGGQLKRQCFCNSISPQYPFGYYRLMGSFAYISTIRQSLGF